MAGKYSMRKEGTVEKNKSKIEIAGLARRCASARRRVVPRFAGSRAKRNNLLFWTTMIYGCPLFTSGRSFQFSDRRLLCP
jgi:hypothetical protein